MKNILLFLFVFLFGTGITEAKFTQNFEKKGLTPKYILEMDSKVQRELTIGKVSEKAVTKYKTFDEYWKVRDVTKQASGKGFEVLAIEKYNRCSSQARRSLCTTAALKSPHDAADILKFNNTTRKIQGKFQFKFGKNAVEKALKDPKEIAKYADCTIVTTRDSFEEITEELRKEINKHNYRGKPLPIKWQTIRNAIKSGKLTASIDDVIMPSRLECEIFTKQELQVAWDKVQKVVTSRQIEKRILTKVTKVGLVSSRYLLKSVAKYSGKLLLKGAGVAGVILSAREIYRLWNGKQGRDIAIYKTGLEASQYLLPLLVVTGPAGWIIGGSVLVGTIVADSWLTNLQVRRDQESQRLLRILEQKTRCKVTKEILSSYVLGVHK